jgi:hypothetical protein
MSHNVAALNTGSFIIEYLELRYLKNIKQPLDLIPFTFQFDIYESIYHPYISATAILDDSRGIVIDDSIIGSTIVISYKSQDKLTNFVKMEFIIDGVDLVMHNGDSRGQTYLIKMFTPECKRALAVLVNENYLDLAPETMIGQILKQKVNTNKAFYFSRTKSIDSINCYSLHPFQAIDMIKRRAVSRDYESSSFMFFESQHGYVFKTIEEILEKAKTDPDIQNGDMIFSKDATEAPKAAQSSWRRIQNFQVIKQGSLNNQICDGAIKSNIFAYNINTGEHYRFDYDGTSFSPKNDFVKINAADIYKQGDQNSLYVATIQSENELLRIKKELLAKAYASKLSSSIARMEIPGDSRITVGRAAKINIPKMISSTVTETNEISSGIYIFAKIRHTFDPAGSAQGGSYKQTCEMMNIGVI